MAQYMLEKQVIKHSKGLWLLPYMLVKTVVSIQFAIDVHIFYIDFLFMYDINPQSQRKCCVHCSIVMWNVSAHRWLHKGLATKESVNRPYDHLISPFLEFVGEKKVTGSTLNWFIGDIMLVKPSMCRDNW